jgi:type I restriction enzyme S subunit
MSYKRLGDYIIEKVEFNDGDKYKLLQGVSNNKYFQKAKTNIIGIDLAKYRVAHYNQFVFNRATTRNGDKISIALRKGKSCIVSPSYRIFEVRDENVLHPDYLQMWFTRPEFDRYARFKSHGSAHEFFNMDEMCEVELPIPSIEEQRQIVAQYQSIANKIKVNEQICEKLEATAQALYKHWFVDFDFPNEDGKPYKSSDDKMVWNEELGKEIPEGWEVGKLKNIIYYSNTKISLKQLTSQNYISTESMLTDKRGVDFISNVPEGNNVSEFMEGDILISNIRPYLKKIWFADINGGCSNDVLCLRSKEPVFQFFALNILFNDQFFDYVMQGAKGTKMPRGDKDWILDYKILLPNVSVLDLYSEEIQLVNKVKKLKTKQNQKLTQLQSLLLSRLAVGEEVSD